MGGCISKYFGKDGKFRLIIDIFCWVMSYFVFIFVGGLLIKEIEKYEDFDVKTARREALLQVLDKYNISTNDSMILEIIRVAMDAHDVDAIDYENITSEIHSSWNVASAVFFCSTVVTTIGYGNITPITSYGKIFTILYAIIGIPLTGIVLSKIGGILTNLVKKCDDFLSVYVKRVIGTFAKNELKVKLYVRTTQLLITIFFIILFFWIFPAIIMVETEQWTYLDSIYFCFISLTTIGLGDITPGSSTRKVQYRKFGHEDFKSLTLQVTVLLYLLIGLSALTIILKLASSLTNIIAESAMERAGAAGGLMSNGGRRILTNMKRKANSIVPIDNVIRRVEEKMSIITERTDMTSSSSHENETTKDSSLEENVDTNDNTNEKLYKRDSNGSINININKRDNNITNRSPTKQGKESKNQFIPESENINEDLFKRDSDISSVGDHTSEAALNSDIYINCDAFKSKPNLNTPRGVEEKHGSNINSNDTFTTLGKKGITVGTEIDEEKSINDQS